MRTLVTETTPPELSVIFNTHVPAHTADRSVKQYVDRAIDALLKRR